LLLREAVEQSAGEQLASERPRREISA